MSSRRMEGKKMSNNRQPMPRHMPRGPRPKVQKGCFKRVLRLLVSYYPVLVPLAAFCILFSAAVAAVPDVFIQKVIAVIEKWYVTKDWAAASRELWPMFLILVGLYVLSLLSVALQTQMMAYITQGFLSKLRCTVFEKMQNFPVRYFDSNKHGDIMSHYTNDIDTLRQLISQSMPSLLRTGVTVICVLGIMLYYSIWMTLIIFVGVIALTIVVKKIGGGSAKYFMRQQKALGKAEGYVQEAMNGQKVIKVFSHENISRKEFDEINTALYEDSRKAHAYANMMGPINQNIGNILYVLVAIAGGIFVLSGTQNFSISGLAFSISIVVPFLNMTKQFTGNINQFSQQINSIVMGLAGADRLFTLMDSKPETDEGDVTLVHAVEAADGTLSESETRTGKWAWKVPGENGESKYTPLCGDVRLLNVDFGYVPEKSVLKNVSVYAEPGQKVAFVGATGAGKTTITNLINRFYDIEKGEILYDGIDVKRIRKADLRRSLGIVLQETNLFSGTVMDNIRYGRLDATDEECRAAAVLAGADDFVRRLTDGYDTMLSNNGANLSQGQRQLLAIARAAVADPPVMILDEATSSIDTRTEAIVQRGMDKLMEGRTVFVIAHRLSTVMNSDVIMVLENGEIIERGTHAQLISEKGTYYRLYTGAFELE